MHANSKPWLMTGIWAICVAFSAAQSVARTYNMCQPRRAFSLCGLVCALALFANSPASHAQGNVRKGPVDTQDHFMMEQRPLPGASGGQFGMGKGRVDSGEDENFDTHMRQFLNDGRYDQLEHLIRERLDRLERVHGANNPRVATALKNLALVYHLQARYRDAGRLYERALEIRRKVYGSSHPQVALVLSQLAELYQVQDRFEEAEINHKSAVQILQQTRGPDHLDVGLSYNNLARFYFVQKRYDEAERLFREALRIFDLVRAPNHSDVALASTNLALLYQVQGRFEEAKSHFLRARDIFRVLGKERPDLAVALYNLAELYADQLEWPKALESYDEATQIITRQVRRAPQSTETTRIPWNRAAFSGNINAAWQVARMQHVRHDKLADRSFKLAQWIAQTATAGALAQMSARLAKGDRKLSGLVRERQDFLQEWQLLDKQMLLAVSRLSEERHADDEKAKRDRLAVIDERLTAIDRQLNVEFPQYAELANPEPLSIPEVQDLLHGNEALIFFRVMTGEKRGGEQTHIWIVTQSESRWIRSDLDARSLRQEVKALRCGLDATAWYGDGALSCASTLGIGLDQSPGKYILPPFDATRAHDLYKSLFNKIENMTGDKHLLIVPSGALTALPLQVLVTEPPNVNWEANSGDFTEISWLGQRQSITVLPSVSSLKALRGHANEHQVKQAFIGFGNPLLTGPDGTNRSAWTRQSCLEPKQPSSQFRLAAAALKQQIASFFRSGLASVDDVRRQTPLPETADELCAVARASGVTQPDRMVHLGARATEAQVKTLSDNGMLARARVVHFATHGLIAGETASLAKDRAEPALILTPPDKATRHDDGLLTASEVTNLKLDADWVILSACNTAAGDTIGGDAFSGLARAFFYAGSRALLVSHWYVDSQATVSLITSAFNALKSDPKIGRAEAMRRAMVNLIKRGGRNAHPANWAPFVVVGEGGNS